LLDVLVQGFVRVADDALSHADCLNLAGQAHAGKSGLADAKLGRGLLFSEEFELCDGAHPIASS